MHFANPNLLMLLLVLPPALVGFFWWSWRQRQALMAQFIQARLLPGLVAGLSPTRERVRFAALVLAIAAILLALARPQWGFTWQEVKQRGVDIIVAIDTSKSMLATDIAPSRLARAKLAALELMQLAKSDRLGVVAFAGTAFLQCPLTIDEVAFRQSVDTLDVNTIPQGGTALAEAIQAAQAGFKENDNHKVLVLLTDGEDHDSGALAAAQKAAEAGLKIFTIGIGTADGDLLRIKDPQGHEDYVRDEQGNVVKSHLNERLLQEIAGASQGGFYLPLRGPKVIDTLYEQGLAKLPKSEHQERLVKQYEERYQWPLGLAILLLIAEFLLPERKRETVLRPAGLAPARPVLRAAAVLLLAGLLARPVLGSPSGALREYKNGHYDQALQEYENLIKKHPDDPRLHFNAGAAAYRNRQFDAAAREFNQAVASPDLQLQQLAYYNRGNAQYWLGEQNPDPKQRTDAWEKALKDYELSMKLDSRHPDADAKFNHEFVKKKLEDFKQQQQQQSKNDKSDQQNQEQQQQQNQKGQQNDQQKQDQKQQQQQQSQSGQKPDQKQPQEKQQQPAQQQQAKQDQKQQQAAADQAQKKPAQQPTSRKGEDKETKDQQAQAQAADEMTPQQAAQLLDAEKGEEQMLPARPETKPADPNKPLKDW